MKLSNPINLLKLASLKLKPIMFEIDAPITNFLCIHP